MAWQNPKTFGESEVGREAWRLGMTSQYKSTADSHVLKVEDVVRDWCDMLVITVIVFTRELISCIFFNWLNAVLFPALQTLCLRNSWPSQTRSVRCDLPARTREDSL